MSRGNQVHSIMTVGLLLELVAKRPRTASELCLLLDIQPATMHNILRSLRDCGLLERGPGRPAPHFPGPLMTNAAAERSRWLLEAWGHRALPPLQRCLRATQSSLAIRTPQGFRLLMRQEPHKMLECPHDDEPLLHPYASTHALVFAAFMPPTQLWELWQQFPFEQHGLSAWPSETPYLDALSLSRRRGYAALTETPDAWLDIALPVYGPSGQLLASLAVRWKKEPVAFSLPAALTLLRQWLDDYRIRAERPWVGPTSTPPSEDREQTP